MVTRPPQRKHFPIPVYDARRFTWTGKVGVVERSDLLRDFATQVWDDSCDLGFTVISFRTGRELLFVGPIQVLTGPDDDDSTSTTLVFNAYDGPGVPSGIQIHVLND